MTRHLSQQDVGLALGLTPLALNDAEWGRGPLTTEAIEALAVRVKGLPARGK